MIISKYVQHNLKAIKYRELRLKAGSMKDYQRYKFLEFYYKWKKAQEGLSVANKIGPKARATAMRSAYQMHKETLGGTI